MFFLQSRSTHRSVEVTHSQILRIQTLTTTTLLNLTIPMSNQLLFETADFINVESQQATDLLHALYTSSLDRHATLYIMLLT